MGYQKVNYESMLHMTTMTLVAAVHDIPLLMAVAMMVVSRLAATAVLVLESSQ